MKKGSREYVDSRAKTTQVNLQFDNFELSDLFSYLNLWYLVYSVKSVSAGREFFAVLAVYCIRGFYFFLLGLFYSILCSCWHQFGIVYLGPYVFFLLFALLVRGY